MKGIMSNMWLITYYIGLAAGFFAGYKVGKDNRK